MYVCISKKKKKRRARASRRLLRPLATRWTMRGSFPQKSAGNVTKFAGNKTAKSIVCRKVDF